MEEIPHIPAVLLLADGSVFHGQAAGAVGTTTGEIAFNTGMTGYQEIFTDPSYYGQIVVMATAHIGNYGTHIAEIESDKVMISGLVVKKFSETFSRVGETSSLQSYLARDGKVGIRDVDTRALIRHIRHKGAMNAIVSSETTDIAKLKEMLSKVPSMEGLELASKVSCKAAFEVGSQDAELRVAVVDFGAKKNIVRCLVERGALCKVFPMDTPLAEMEAWNPDGYMLSNGPGDPGVMRNAHQLTREIIDLDKPVFGICLGHQIIALSQGIKTVKMFNGHRGINHPVRNVITSKGEITSQNHGFVVDMDSARANENIEVTHVHVNDGTLAGIRLKQRPVFSVQFHPESSPGPHDSRYLFDQFIESMAEVKSHSTAS